MPFRLSIKNMVLIISTISVLMITVLTMSHVYENQLQVNTSKNSQTLFSGMQVLDQLTTDFAIERGLSSGYLGEPTKDKLILVNTQRVNLDESIAAFDELLEEWKAQPKLYAILFSVKQSMSQLFSVRAQVERQNKQQAFQFYSSVISRAINAINALRSFIPDPQQQLQIEKAVQLIWFKERSGQLRGLINHILAKQTLSRTEQQSVKNYLQDLHRAEEYLNGVLTGQDLDDFMLVSRGKTATSIAQVHQYILNHSVGQISNMPTPAKAWFEFATRQIAQINIIITSNWKTNIEHANAEYGNARFSQILMGGLAILSVMIIIGVSFAILRIINKQTAHIKRHLQQVVEKGDMSSPLLVIGNDEFSDITDELRESHYHIKQVFEKLDYSVQNTRYITNVFNNLSAKSVKDSVHSHTHISELFQHVHGMSENSQTLMDTLERTKAVSKALAHNGMDAAKQSYLGQFVLEELSLSLKGILNNTVNTHQQINLVHQLLVRNHSVNEQLQKLTAKCAEEISLTAHAESEHNHGGVDAVLSEVNSLATAVMDDNNQACELLEQYKASVYQLSDDINKADHNIQKSLTHATQANDAVVELNTEAQALLQKVMHFTDASMQQVYFTKNLASQSARIMEIIQREVDTTQEIESLTRDLYCSADELRMNLQEVQI